MRIARNGFAYATKFKLWESRAAVRTKPRRVLLDEREQGKIFFPPELVPFVQHPLVVERGEGVIDALLLDRLHLYLDFTAELEQMAVNPVTQRISRRKGGFEVPEEMVEDAYKICTDEAWHAQFSDDLQRQLVEMTGKGATLPAEPQFFRRLRETEADTSPDLRGLPTIFFTIISETLISAILADIPHDRRVVTAVRELVADHAEDEGRHHAFFTKYFSCIWPQLSAKQRRAIGPILPGLVVSFLEPDFDALAAILKRSMRDEEKVHAVIEESYPRAQLNEEIRTAAKATIRLFETHGVLTDSRTRHAFEAAGLVG